jgi:hypothetical protein
MLCIASQRAAFLARFGRPSFEKPFTPAALRAFVGNRVLELAK